MSSEARDYILKELREFVKKNPRVRFVYKEYEDSSAHCIDVFPRRLQTQFEPRLFDMENRVQMHVLHTYSEGVAFMTDLDFLMSQLHDKPDFIIDGDLF